MKSSRELGKVRVKFERELGKFSVKLIRGIGKLSAMFFVRYLTVPFYAQKFVWSALIWKAKTLERYGNERVGSVR